MLRDIDILNKLNSEVGLTVTTFEDRVVRFLEGSAPSASVRIKALKKLDDAGIPIYAFVGPLLPYFVARGEKLKEHFRKLKEAGVKEVYIEKQASNLWVEGFYIILNTGDKMMDRAAPMFI